LLTWFFCSGKTIAMNIPFLTKKQKKELFERVAEVVAKELQGIKESKTFTFKEIATISSLTQNRLSELVKKNVINDKKLIGLIGGGMVKVSDILKKVGPLTDQERAYLENFYIYESPDLKALLLKYREQKLDPIKVLKAGLKK
jgi:hypothetical protein